MQQVKSLDINLRYLEVNSYEHITSSEFLINLQDTSIPDKQLKTYAKALGHHLYTFKLNYKEPSAMNTKELYTGVWYIRKRVQDFQKISLISKKLPLFLYGGKELQRKLENSPDQIIDLLQTYLIKLISQNQDNPPQILLNFLQFSYFRYGTQIKYHECYLLKKTGGRYGESKCARCGTLCRIWTERLFVITSEAIMYSQGHLKHNCDVREIIYFDYEFSIKYGSEKTGSERGIILKSSTRRLELKAPDIFVYFDFLDRLKQAVLASPYTILQRFASFAPIRQGACKWYISGEEYFSDLYDALVKAQKSIYITGWWLSPEFYLKRPVGRSLTNQDSRFDYVLKRVAERGVSIMIVVYNEVTLALGNNSEHTKLHLESLSPNIKVYRHPNQKLPYLWSHHDKMVIVDQQVGFMGGLDICFGRMDNKDHLLYDLHFEKSYEQNEVYEYWPGIDYANNRIKDFINVKDHQVCLLQNKREDKRMPWQDIAIQVIGDQVIDMTRHFIQLWNFVTIDINFKHRKDAQLLQPYKRQHDQPIKSRLGYLLQRISKKSSDSPLKEQLITTNKSQQSNINQLLPNYKQGHLNDYIKQIEDQYKNSFHEGEGQMNEESKSNLQQQPKKETLQLVSDQSFKAQKKQSFIAHGSFITQRPNFFYEYLQMIKKLQTFQLDENYRSFSSTIIQPQQKTRNTDKPGMWDAQFVLDGSLSLSEGYKGTCECQMVRSVSKWSIGCKDMNTEMSIQIAYISLIAESQHFIYIENQFFISESAGDPVQNQISNALVTRIKQAAAAKEQFKVVIFLPLLPGFQGEIDGSSNIMKLQLHWEYATISRGGSSLIEQLSQDPNILDPFEYIQFYSLRQHARSPLSGNPNTEIIYIHSKLMIIDDEIVLLGSANINDRSLMGSRDSEIAMIIHDQDKIETRLAGMTIKRSKFAHTLRKTLYETHMGLSDVIDPLDFNLNQQIRDRARINTLAYRKVFACYPDDSVGSMDQLNEFKMSADLCQYEEEFNKVKGQIVEFPLNFLINEDLKLGIFQKESLCPTINFT